MPQKNIKTLEDIVEQGAKVEKVLSGYQFTEGQALSRLGFLVFSDIPANRIYKYVPGEQAQIFRENSSGSNDLFSTARGGYWLAKEPPGVSRGPRRTARLRCWPTSSRGRR